MRYDLTYKPFGDSAILVEWPARIDEKIILDIVNFDRRIDEDYFRLHKIIAYNSLLVRYDEVISDYEKEVTALKKIYNAKKRAKAWEENCIWEVPVCYDTIFGLDIEEIATAKGISIEEVIELHIAPNYLVYFIGFQPGFMYLGGLDERIHMPRKENPRLRISKGSVGIGGPQTGIYPQDSAGGWNIIGKSPIPLFEIDKPELCFAKAGDRIEFKSISHDVFYKIEKEVAEGSYQLKSRKL